MEDLPRAVPVERTAVKMDAVCCGNSVCIEIFGIAVARDDVEFAFVERLVHLFDEIGVQKVVRIEYHVSFHEVYAVIFAYFIKTEFERPAFARVRGVVPLVHRCALFARDGGGGVGTVVGYHENAELVFRIPLRGDAVEQIADDLFLVAGADDDGVRMLLFRLGENFRFAEKTDDEIEIAVAHHHHDDFERYIKNFERKIHFIFPFS